MLRIHREFLAAALVLTAAARTFAQEHQHDPAQQTSAQHQHEHDDAAPSLFETREGSGTAWLPVTTEMYALHRRAGNWGWMFHGNAFLQFLDENANVHRGSSQAGSINWLMMMGRRDFGAAQVGFRTMISLEPATIGGCGYPDLLATGELCESDSIHDRQHPHDFLMEIAGQYDRPV